MNNLKPWIRGLIDGLTATKMLNKTILPSKNRLALIILDSTLEIAFKDFLIYEKKIKKENLEFREKLHKIVKNNTSFDKEVWDRVEFYYQLRCGLYHEESAKTLSDDYIDEFYEIVEFFIDEIFNIESRKHILSIDDVFSFEELKILDINSFDEVINKLIVVIKSTKSKDATDIQDNLSRMGIRKKIEINIINKYIKDAYKHLFYYDNKLTIWTLSDAGELRYKDITKDLNNIGD
ncbi:MAG: hypothetical protein AABX35_04275 [Nanoarchaeota archaeon]